MQLSIDVPTRTFFLLINVLSERCPMIGLKKIIAKAIMERIFPVAFFDSR